MCGNDLKPEEIEKAIEKKSNEEARKKHEEDIAILNQNAREK